MPNRDGTGPEGKGPMTGCGRGYCVIPINTPEKGLTFFKIRRGFAGAIEANQDPN
jgi:hypothetical protein